MGADEIVKVVFFRDLPYEVIYSDGRKRFVEKVVEEWSSRSGSIPCAARRPAMS